uniref:Link domain-containing protein n=1 Tax=Sphaeramia orbicularis TaxID=375764 RepID=A0A672Z1P0_9TELE
MHKHNTFKLCIFHIVFWLFLVHEGPRSTGVFMVTEGGQYGFNFTEAIATCQYLNVTIATKAQIEQALAHGLETCK